MPRRARELKASEIGKLGEGVHAVGGVDGLALQVREGNRSWVLRVSAADGRRLTLGVGSATDYSLAEARQRGLALRKRVRDEGHHPKVERQQARASAVAMAATQITFKKAGEDFIRDNAAGWKNAKHAAQWSATLRTYAYPVVGSVPVADVTTAHVLEVLKRDNFWAEKPETASRVRQRIEAIIGAADASAGRERLNPARWEVVGRSLPAKAKVAQVEHHAAMPWAQVPAFMTDLAKRAGTAAKALQFLIHSAARSGEVRGATWGEIDLEARTWTIPSNRMKAGREHVVPLTDAAIALLPEPGEPDALVFPGATGRPLSDMTMTALLKRMNVNATPHGFRSSFRDWAGESTAHPREVIEHALAHQLKDKAEAAYARSSLLAKRRALMADWSGFIAAEVE